MERNKNLSPQGKTTYNVKEVATLLNICLPAAYDLCNREDFPAIRITPRRIIIPADGLQRWLEEQATSGKAGGVQR